MNPPNPQHLPDELIHEVLSWLLVKDLTRLRCVCKSWNTTILSDSTFIKLHLSRSASRNPHFLVMFDQIFPRGRDRSIVHFPIRRLIQNPSMSLPDDPRHWLKSDDFLTQYFNVIGSCNGLICLHGYSFDENAPFPNNVRYDWLRFWNPATGLITGRLGCRSSTVRRYRFTFGYDNSTDAFKVVFFDWGRGGKKRLDEPFPARVFTLGCNLWRDIQNLPLYPYGMDQKPNNGGVNLRGTVNWLACDKKYYASDTPQVKQFMILSLDLGTEAYTQFLLPPDLGERIFVGALMDCLCFSHISKTTHFVMWQMKEFGVENSWTQLLKISYQDLHMDPLNDRFSFPLFLQLFPLYFYNGDTLMLACDNYDQAILYNMRDNRAKRTRLPDTDLYWYSGMGYVESLVSPCGG